MPVDLDPRLVEEIKSAAVRPCEAIHLHGCWIHGIHRVPCDRTATWALRARCPCGKADVALLCDEHVEIVRGAGADATAVCSACGQTIPNDLLTMERI